MSKIKRKQILLRAKLNQRQLVTYIKNLYHKNPKKLTQDECEALWAQINFTLQTFH
jgi:hypothetical protein